MKDLIDALTRLHTALAYHDIKLSMIVCDDRQIKAKLANLAAQHNSNTVTENYDSDEWITALCGIPFQSSQALQHAKTHEYHRGRQDQYDDMIGRLTKLLGGTPDANA